MRKHKQVVPFILGVSLVGYWVGLLAISLLARTPTEKIDFLFPLLLLAGLPIYLIAARAIVHETDTDNDSNVDYEDGLTGLRNHRAFQNDAKIALSTAGPGKLGLLVVEVGGMKALNESCAHQSGDELIASVASHLESVGGPLYRTGGDQFAMLIPSSEAGSVTLATEELEPYTATFASCGNRHEVRVTYGTTLNQPGDDVESFFHRATDPLLENKRALYSISAVGDRRNTAGEALAQEKVRRDRLRLIS